MFELAFITCCSHSIKVLSKIKTYFGQEWKNIKVYYETDEVGDYYADLLVEGLVIIEVKAAKSLAEEHEAQLVNYLKATTIEVGLLINFGKEPNFKRKIFENRFKKNLTQSN